MSTKSTIAYGDNFHFYREALDRDHVYLQLDTTHFEAGYSHVMIPIPIHIWETIRHLGVAELDLVDQSDEQLLARVQKEVEERVAKYQKIARERPSYGNLFAIAGSLVYGTADAPLDSQVRDGMEYFRRERRRQQEVQTRIMSLRRGIREDRMAPEE